MSATPEPLRLDQAATLLERMLDSDGLTIIKALGLERYIALLRATATLLYASGCNKEAETLETRIRQLTPAADRRKRIEAMLESIPVELHTVVKRAVVRLLRATGRNKKADELENRRK